MLQNEITTILASLQGKIGVYYKDLTSGETVEFNGQESFIAASVIKLPILAAVFHEIQEGRLRRDDILRLSAADKVPSCGALNQMHSGVEVTIKDLCNLMITLSDNTATNILIKTLGIDKINAIFGEYGLKRTRLNRLLFDSEAQKRGLENYFTPGEIGALLEQIFNKTLITEAVSREIEEILRRQQLNAKIPHLLPKNIAVGHKTGEDSGITHDVGIVYAANPFILCFASTETDVISTEAAIRTVALHCYGNASRG